MQGRTALGLDRFEDSGGVEMFRGDHHAGPVAGTDQVAQDHSKSVVERDRNAQPVRGGEAQSQTGEIAVVEDVVVGERRPLGKAGGAGGVLDIDGVVALQTGLVASQLSRSNLSARFQQSLPVSFERKHLLQCGTARPDGRQHGSVGVLAKAGAVQQHADTRLFQDILHLGRLVSRVDVDQDDPQARRGVLEHHPLEAVGGPDANALAGWTPMPSKPRAVLVVRSHSCR